MGGKSLNLLEELQDLQEFENHKILLGTVSGVQSRFYLLLSPVIPVFAAYHYI